MNYPLHMPSYYFPSDFQLKYIMDHNKEAQFDYDMPIPKSFHVDDYLIQEQVKCAAYEWHWRLMQACF